MNPTITVQPRDAGALTIPTTFTWQVAGGSLIGAFVGHHLSKKHGIIGTLIGAGVGGWIGVLAVNAVPATK